MSPMLPRLLIVDDDNIQRMITVKVADAAGYATDGAASFEEALALLCERAYDCLTLDIMLGKDTGIDILRVLKELRSRAHIILISGSHGDILQMAQNVGRLAHLNMGVPMSKPIDFDVLKQTLTALKLKRPGTQVQSSAA